MAEVVPWAAMSRDPVIDAQGVPGIVDTQGVPGIVDIQGTPRIVDAQAVIDAQGAAVSVHGDAQDAPEMVEVPLYPVPSRNGSAWGFGV